METTTFKCDAVGCGQLHTGNNGWYLLRKRGQFLVIGAWMEQEDMQKYEHYCSLSCLFKRISELTGREL